ncbi:hypothetical protein [Myroides odoratus]|uniref:hypothetical protein n=1 Tax=Myroides odoratus TaxID=256 RepID=UPI00333E9BA7
MAGYLFSLNSVDSLYELIQKGYYSTFISESKKRVWGTHIEGTFADFSTMKEGDNVYFFIKRKVYGIGKLVNIGEDCKYFNYPGAGSPITYANEETLVNFGDKNTNHRFICFFEPSPYFFKNGVDMDELLLSAPNDFIILRSFWKLSFIKFSDKENQAFKDVLLRKNIDALNNPHLGENVFNFDKTQIHENLRLKELTQFKLKLHPFIEKIIEKGTLLKHEMVIEAGLLLMLTNQEQDAIDVFGQWDYLSHQVIASPFKPIDYIDKIDVFGYRFISKEEKTIYKYLVVEIKKGKVIEADILQLMKYVDWIHNEYALGDYNMIEAYIIGSDFSLDVKKSYKELAQRKYIKEFRPAISKEWQDITLVKYSISNEELKFERVL